MRTNNVRKIRAEGGAVVNGWLGIPSSVSAGVMTRSGFDSVAVDLRHGLVDYQFCTNANDSRLLAAKAAERIYAAGG
jgi:2-keto-3-deoxy-L-rhamnonate aldolase RhmA